VGTPGRRVPSGEWPAVGGELFNPLRPGVGDETCKIEGGKGDKKNTEKESLEGKRLLKRGVLLDADGFHKCTI